MIEFLKLHKLGIIEDAHIDLGPGLTVITGETGAGKTMVLSALRLLLGGRADQGLAASKETSVQGGWELDPSSDFAQRMAEAGVSLPDGELLHGLGDEHPEGGARGQRLRHAELRAEGRIGRGCRDRERGEVDREDVLRQLE